MREEHDSKISDLYQTSSQETPPAHVDRAVMSMARKSLRRRAYSPFGNHWVAGGAMVGVVMLSVLLILAVPPQPDTYAPLDDASAPLSDLLSEELRERKHRKALMSEMGVKKDEIREETAAPKPRFNFYTVLPEMEVVIPEEEIQMQLQQAPAAKESARVASALPAEAIYLQVGSFRKQTHAEALKAKLVELGFKCEIQKISIDDANVYHRVRVGPFTDYVVLDKSRKKLRELGFETQVVKKRE
jgi:cell division septation protein DedD